MKVVHAVRSDAFGGVERYISNVAPALVGRGLDVVVVGGAARRMSSLSAAGIEVVAARTTFEVARSLLALDGVDIVHAHMTAAEVASALIKPLHRWKLISTRHFAAERGSGRWARPMVRLVERSMNAEVAASAFVAGQLRSAPRVIHHGVACRSASSAGEPIVLVAQRLEAEKRTDIVLRAWEQSALRKHGWLLQIAGDGNERDRLEQLSGDLEIASSVTFLGRVDNVEQFMEKASLFVATGVNDAFGLAAVEAMAVGLPCLATASGAHFETVGAATPAALYPSDDPAALTRLLDALESPEARAAISSKQQDFQREHLSLDRHIDALLALYTEVSGRT